MQMSHDVGDKEYVKSLKKRYIFKSMAEMLGVIGKKNKKGRSIHTLKYVVVSPLENRHYPPNEVLESKVEFVSVVQYHTLATARIRRPCGKEEFVAVIRS